MIDFELTEHQKILQRTTHEFAKKELRPLAAEIDLDPDPDAALRTREVLIKARRLGFGKLLIPEKYGGYGGSCMDWVIVTEEFSWGDPGLGVVIGGGFGMFPLVIAALGTEKQKEKWLPYFGEDEVLATGCFTEPTGGSEILCPLPDPDLGVQTTAVREGNYYVINGTKCFSTDLSMANVAFVLARTDKTKPNLESCSIFIVPTDTPGFKVGRAEDKMGFRTLHNCEVTFENMRVPAEDLLGGEDGALAPMYAEAVGNGAQTVGLARAVYEEVSAYARERIIWGKPLWQFENVATKIVDMATKIMAMRAMVWQLAWAVDHSEKAQGLEKLSAMAKVFPTSLIRGITADALQIMGGYGYMKHSLIERWVRDALLMPISGTPNEVHTYFLAQELLGEK